MARGEIFGFLGPNGSGKTTSIRMMCGLLTPDSGSGTCLGYDILKQSDEIKRRVGYMTQRFSFWDDLSIRENLDFVARIYEMPSAARGGGARDRGPGPRRRARRSSPGALSGGWKQRLALAACMLHEPELLLLDEPTAGVDPGARRDFWDELHALAARGISVLVSTHYMDEAERCHKLAYIAFGKLMAQGTAEEIIAGPEPLDLGDHGRRSRRDRRAPARGARRRAGRRLWLRAARDRARCCGAGGDAAPCRGRHRRARGASAEPGWKTCSSI